MYVATIRVNREHYVERTMTCTQKGPALKEAIAGLAPHEQLVALVAHDPIGDIFDGTATGYGYEPR